MVVLWPYANEWDDGRKFAELFIWCRKTVERRDDAVCYSHEKISNYTLFPLILIHYAFSLLSLFAHHQSSPPHFVLLFLFSPWKNYCVLFLYVKGGEFGITLRFIEILENFKNFKNWTVFLKKISLFNVFQKFKFLINLFTRFLN
jgi:hypothetical protein